MTLSIVSAPSEVMVSIQQLWTSTIFVDSPNNLRQTKMALGVTDLHLSRQLIFAREQHLAQQLTEQNLIDSCHLSVQIASYFGGFRCSKQVWRSVMAYYY